MEIKFLPLQLRLGLIIFYSTINPTQKKAKIALDFYGFKKFIYSGTSQIVLMTWSDVIWRQMTSSDVIWRVIWRHLMSNDVSSRQMTSDDARFYFCILCSLFMKLSLKKLVCNFFQYFITTVNLCNQALGQESKFLVRYPGMALDTRIEIKFIFFQFDK